MQAVSIIITTQRRNQPKKPIQRTEPIDLTCSQQILTAGPNGKDNKNAQHRRDLSKCLHKHVQMRFTNVTVSHVEYKVYFNSTQNLPLLYFMFQALLPFYLLHFSTSLTSRRQTTSAHYLIKVTH